MNVKQTLNLLEQYTKGRIKSISYQIYNRHNKQELSHLTCAAFDRIKDLEHRSKVYSKTKVEAEKKRADELSQSCREWKHLSEGLKEKKDDLTTENQRLKERIEGLQESMVSFGQMDIDFGRTKARNKKLEDQVDKLIDMFHRHHVS